MSRVIFTDNNRVLPEHAQPIGAEVAARKRLHIERIGRVDGARLFFFARRMRTNMPKMTVAVNGRQIGQVGAVARAAGFGWFSVNVPPEALRRGDNDIVLASPTCTPGDWRLALAATPRPAQSFASPDGGKTWGAEHLGRFAAMTGEYLVRLRLDDGQPIPEPEFIPEPDSCPELGRLRQALPEPVVAAGPDTYERARQLGTWLARRLTYANTDDASQYCPWNFWEILRGNDDNKRALQRGRPTPNIVMCVHFAVAYVQAATALGVKARCMVCTAGIHTSHGHFFPEVWLPERECWAVVDPTGDFVFIDEDGAPRGACDLYAHRDRLPAWLTYGPGWARHRKRLGGFRDVCVRSGATYRNLGYWRRHDFFSHPEEAASVHGAVSYCEPDIVWLQGDDQRLAAFPYDCRTATK